VVQNFTPGTRVRGPACCCSFFKGEDGAQAALDRRSHRHERTSGETIRDTYGDYVADAWAG